MARKLTVFLLIIANIVPLSAQKWDDIVAKKSVYLTGEGWGETVREADEQALADLISKISVVVSKDVVVTDDEKVTNGTFNATSYAQSKIKTYSSASLTNTEKLVLSNEPDAHVGRFIKRSELDKIFKGRELKIKDYIRLADAALQKNKIDDALRSYYWAYSLLKTLPNPNSVKGEDGSVLLVWLPARMNEVFDDIEATVSSVNGSDVEIVFTFRGKPVASLDYTYFDGKDWSNIYSAKNGRGVLELPSGVMPKTVQLKYEYDYKGQSHIDNEIKDVFAVVKGKALRKSYANVPLEETKKTPIGKTTVLPTVTSNNLSKYGTLMAPSANETAQVKAVLDKVVAAIRKKQYSTVYDCFTPQGKELYTKLIHYGNAKVLQFDTCIYEKYEGGIIVRSVPMSFSFKQGVRKSFVENVVFTFNNTGKIDYVAFGLEKEAVDDVLSRPWPIASKQKVILFLEDYKTAFALKRLDYIESIFDNDAVIIVGHTVQKMERASGDANKYNMNKYVKRTQYTKEQYMKNLERCFKSNEFVNLRFANNQVLKAGSGGETYGIQIKQDYYSTTYGDSGYLFLKVDLNDQDKPIIRVRTWQDQPDPELGRVYGLEDF